MTRTERTYYLVFGLYSLWAWFLAPVYPLFLRSRGLDALEVNLILATYLIVIFVFEVPTGAAADVVGRKECFRLSPAQRAATRRARRYLLRTMGGGVRSVRGVPVMLHVCALTGATFIDLIRGQLLC